MLPYVSSYGPKLAWFLSRFFPVTEQDFGSASAVGFDQYVSRFLGLTLACQFTFCYLLARWGLREIFSFHKPWRLFLLVGVGLLGALGGFRSYMALAGLAFLFVFYLEGLVRSRYMIGLCAAVLIGGALLIPFSDKLPLSIQRSISFLPVEIDPVARFDAENSSRWRFELWGAVWPEVHRYFWRGRGLSLEARDYEAATLEGDMVRRPSFLYATEVATGDFHSGPLTVIVPFGIWGVLAWLWFLGAGIRATYLNYRHGDSALSKVNTFLFAYFLTRTVVFFLVFGNLYSDIPLFTGLLGLSMAINGGIREPAPAPARETPRYAAFQRPVPRAGTLKVSETAGSHCPG
jgi:hypothetical protein